MTLIFARLCSFKKFNIFSSLLLVVGCLFFLYLLVFSYPILACREGFDVTSGGETLGIEFASAASFLPDLFRSTAAQLFGLHFFQSCISSFFGGNGSIFSSAHLCYFE